MDIPDWMAGVAAVAMVIISALALYLKHGRRPPRGTLGGGGDGGNASVGRDGTAVGRNGGRSGGSGYGGKGGNAFVTGSGTSVGGDGGDAGVPWRPALGASSPLGRLGMDSSSYALLPKDELGLISAGRGGVGGCQYSEVKTNNGTMSLIQLTRLVQLWSPDTIDIVDHKTPKDGQEFWDILRQVDVNLAERAEKHVMSSKDAKAKGLPPPNPYE